MRLRRYEFGKFADSVLPTYLTTASRRHPQKYRLSTTGNGCQEIRYI